MRVDELRALALFEGLTDQQLAELVEGSAEVSVQPGAELFREGEHADFWWVLLDGVIDLVRQIGPEETVDELRGMLAVPATDDRATYQRAGYVAAMRAANAGMYGP